MAYCWVEHTSFTISCLKITMYYIIDAYFVSESTFITIGTGNCFVRRLQGLLNYW
jgi:hypothetical protein